MIWFRFIFRSFILLIDESIYKYIYALYISFFYISFLSDFFSLSKSSECLFSINGWCSHNELKHRKIGCFTAPSFVSYCFSNFNNKAFWLRGQIHTWLMLPCPFRHKWWPFTGTLCEFNSVSKCTPLVVYLLSASCISIMHQHSPLTEFWSVVASEMYLIFLQVTMLLMFEAFSHYCMPSYHLPLTNMLIPPET